MARRRSRRLKNPVARALILTIRPKVRPSAKVYKRKGRHAVQA